MCVILNNTLFFLARESRSPTLRLYISFSGSDWSISRVPYPVRISRSILVKIVPTATPIKNKRKWLTCILPSINVFFEFSNRGFLQYQFNIDFCHPRPENIKIKERERGMCSLFFRSIDVHVLQFIVLMFTYILFP